MGRSLFDVLSGLEMGVSQADANIGKYLDRQASQEEADLKRQRQEAQINQMRLKPQMDEMKAAERQEEQMVKDAIQEIKLLEKELKSVGFMSSTFSPTERRRIRDLEDRKNKLLQFVEEMSTVPNLSDEIDYEEDEGYEE